MKTITEIKNILHAEVQELDSNLSLDQTSPVINPSLGDLSFVLAGYVYLCLQEIDQQWGNLKWVDDIIFTKVVRIEGVIRIWGVLIWGRKNTTAQWTEPICAEVHKLDLEGNIYEIAVLFADKETRPLPYSNFVQNRGVWGDNFYATGEWEFRDIDWIYNFTTRTHGEQE